MAISWTPSSTDNALSVTRLGMSVASPDRAPDHKGKVSGGANGLLRTPDGQMIGLWVNAVASDFALGGTTAQGPTRRDFYGHNFVQPKLTISGQTTNNYEYNRLAAFVRRAQLQSINLDLPDTGAPHTLRLTIRTPSSVKPHSRHMRGRHSDIDVEGFVPAITAGAERFVTAHSYRFDFVILAAYSLLPGLHDRLLVPAQTSSITDRMENGRLRVRKSTDGKPSNTPKDVGARVIDTAQTLNAEILDLFG